MSSTPQTYFVYDSDNDEEVEVYVPVDSYLADAIAAAKAAAPEGWGDVVTAELPNYVPPYQGYVVKRGDLVEVDTDPWGAHRRFWVRAEDVSYVGRTVDDPSVYRAPQHRVSLKAAWSEYQAAKAATRP